MMRKQLNVCMFLVAACSMPSAMADPIAYTIDFTSTFEAGEELPTSGSFDYDSTTQEFSDFSVVFGTNLFDFTAAANGGPSQIGTPPCADGTSAAVASFLLLTSCPSTIWTFYDLGSTGTFNFQSVLFFAKFDFYHDCGEFCRFQSEFFLRRFFRNIFARAGVVRPRVDRSMLYGKTDGRCRAIKLSSSVMTAPENRWVAAVASESRR